MCVYVYICVCVCVRVRILALAVHKDFRNNVVAGLIFFFALFL